MSRLDSRVVRARVQTQTRAHTQILHRYFLKLGSESKHTRAVYKEERNKMMAPDTKWPPPAEEDGYRSDYHTEKSQHHKIPPQIIPSYFSLSGGSRTQEPRGFGAVCAPPGLQTSEAPGGKQSRGQAGGGWGGKVEARRSIFLLPPSSSGGLR